MRSLKLDTKYSCTNNEWGGEEGHEYLMSSVNVRMNSLTWKGGGMIKQVAVASPVSDFDIEFIKQGGGRGLSVKCYTRPRRSFTQ